MADRPFLPYQPPWLDPTEVAIRARAFYEQMDGRRSVRSCALDAVAREVMEDLI